MEGQIPSYESATQIYVLCNYDLLVALNILCAEWFWKFQYVFYIKVKFRALFLSLWLRTDLFYPYHTMASIPDHVNRVSSVNPTNTKQNTTELYSDWWVPMKQHRGSCGLRHIINTSTNCKYIYVYKYVYINKEIKSNQNRLQISMDMHWTAFPHYIDVITGAVAS